MKFDEIITAEQARAYKPSHTGFLLARERLGLDVSEIWHAGFQVCQGYLSSIRASLQLNWAIQLCGLIARGLAAREG